MSTKKRNDSFANLLTGVFMLVVLAALVYFTVVISGVDIVFGRSRVKAQIEFEQVGGLKDHDSVMYRGTKVGTVERIDLSPSNLVVHLEIDKSVVLREGYEINVRSLSLLGGNFLELDEGTGAMIDWSRVMLKGVTPTDWMSDISNVAKNLNKITGQEEIGGIVSNLLVTTEKARLLAERLERGEGLLGKLMASDDTLYRELNATVTNAAAISVDLRKMAANAAVLSERLAKGEGTLGKLMAPGDTLHDDLSAALASFKKACDSFDMGDAKGDIKEVVAGAKSLMTNLTVVAERLKNGEGTLGKLTTDETMYNEVNGLLRDARQILDNYRDTTPISTFTSLATGAL